MKENKSILLKKSFACAVSIVELYKTLVSEKKEFVISKQILRSGTSVAANIREAQNAESTKDFVHKLSIAQKESDETLFWLELLLQTKFISENTFSEISNEVSQILKMSRSAILTIKQKKLITLHS